MGQIVATWKQVRTPILYVLRYLRLVDEENVGRGESFNLENGADISHLQMYTSLQPANVTSTQELVSYAFPGTS